jgi:hypothetical protein
MLSRPAQAGHSSSGRGTQVVRERSAKPLCVGSIPTRASNTLNELVEIIAVSSIAALRFSFAELRKFALVCARSRTKTGQNFN